MPSRQGPGFRAALDLLFEAQCPSDGKPPSKRATYYVCSAAGRRAATGYFTRTIMDTSLYALGGLAAVVLSFFGGRLFIPKVAQVEAKIEDATTDALLHAARVAVNGAIALRDANIAEAKRLSAQAASETSAIQQLSGAISGLANPTPMAS